MESIHLVVVYDQSSFKVFYSYIFVLGFPMKCMKCLIFWDF